MQIIGDVDRRTHAVIIASPHLDAVLPICRPAAMPVEWIGPLVVPLWDYTAPMSELHVRNLPPEVHAWLRQRAKAQGRSMSAEAVAILRSVLESTQSAADRSQAIDQLRAIRQRAHLGAGVPPAEELIRADRERVG